MVLAFQIVLAIVILLSCLGAMGDEEKEISTNMMFVCISAMAAFVVTIIWA